MRNATRGTVVAERVVLADNFVARLCGLIFRAPLASGEGLLLVPCKQIHMMGMKYAIDAVFLDREGTVVGLVEAIKPGAISSCFAGARSCLELPAGTIAMSKTALGDRLENLPVSAA